MISREYDKRIHIFETTKVSDGFAGNTVSEALLFSSWSKIETNGVGYKAKDFGLQEFNSPVLFKTRYRNDFQYQGRTLYVLYAGDKYIIKGVKNVDHRKIEIEIYCSKLDG